MSRVLDRQLKFYCNKQLQIHKREKIDKIVIERKILSAVFKTMKDI